jgi:putative hydrolase of HD superfamily
LADNEKKGRESAKAGDDEAGDGAASAAGDESSAEAPAEAPGKGCAAPEGGKTPLARLADFVYEGLFLKNTPRSGYKFLGRGKESVAEHSYGAAFIAYSLGRMSILQGEEVDMERLLSLALFHDIAEARTGDHNYMNKRYVFSREDLATRDAFLGLPFEEELLSLYKEWKEGASLEARLAKDADQLDMLAELSKIRADGSENAKEWIKYAKMRLVTKAGKSLSDAILDRHPDSWWFQKKKEYWVNPEGPEGPERQGGPRQSRTPPEKPEDPESR